MAQQLSPDVFADVAKHLLAAEDLLYRFRQEIVAAGNRLPREHQHLLTNVRNLMFADEAQVTKSGNCELWDLHKVMLDIARLNPADVAAGDGTN